LTPTIHEALSEYLSASGLPVRVDDQAGRTVVEFETAAAAWFLIAEAYEDLRVASVRSVLAARVEPERRDAVLAVLNQLNLELLLGTWSLDPADGEVQFRMGVEVPESGPTPDLIKPLVAMATFAPEQHADQIAAAARGD
jgi:hypothetical protein